jgi:hypothetical protein
VRKDDRRHGGELLDREHEYQLVVTGLVKSDTWNGGELLRASAEARQLAASVAPIPEASVMGSTAENRLAAVTQTVTFATDSNPVYTHREITALVSCGKSRGFLSLSGPFHRPSFVMKFTYCGEPLLITIAK